MNRIEEFVLKLKMLAERARHSHNYTLIEKESNKSEILEIQKQLISEMRKENYTVEQQRIILDDASLIQKFGEETFHELNINSSD